MPRSDHFPILVEGEEAGSAEIIRRPDGDTIDEILNKYYASMGSPRLFDIVNFTIRRLVAEWDIKDPDSGAAYRFPQDIGKLPADIRSVLYDELWTIVEPLIPNLGRSTKPEI